MASDSEVAPPQIGADASRTITIIAACLGLAITILPPVAYFTRGLASESASLQIQARLIAGQVSALISRSPDSWQMQELRLRLLLMPDGIDLTEPEIRRIVDAEGNEATSAFVQSLGLLPWPKTMQRAPIHDQGAVVGSVEITRSLMSLFVEAMRLALLSLALGLASFVVLRIIPLRLLAGAIARATWLAAHDPLTGLANRAVLRDRLGEALANARRTRTAVAVLCLDLDQFKEVNDTLGHAAGDRLLKEVVGRLRDNIRATDVLARLGGDEFAIVQAHGAQPSFAETLAGRLVRLMAEPFDLGGHQVVIGVSIGIAIAADGNATPETMLQHGDLALYRAKAEGRGAFRFFQQEMNDTLMERRALEADMRTALAEGQFEVYFQPQVSIDAAGVNIHGAESLIRWTSPTRGVMRPDMFIPLAEETGLIIPIGEWVLRQACATAMTWKRPLSVAVNVSTVQFRRPGFVETVEAVLRETGLPAHRLELEITESVMVEDEAAAVQVMDRLRALGVRLAMDDFGTGYSSLGYLRKFRFDKIKIDKSFVQGLGESEEANAIIRAVVGMSQALGISANAEGVETRAQATHLALEGCNEFQGYLYGRPMTAGAFSELLEQAAQPVAAK